MNARQLLLNLVIVVVLLAIGGGIAYESYLGNNYVSTDNAQVTLPVIDVAALGAGRATAVPVQVGESVHAGQTLVEIATAAAASTAATSATTTAGAAKTGTKAGSGGGAGGSAPPPTAVTAPVSGVVSAVDVSVGQTVLPGVTLVEVTQPSRAIAVANIPETAIRNVADGQKVDITVDAYPGTTFTGRVETIQPATQASLSLFPSSALSGSFTKVTQLVPVWISFNSEGDTMYNGLSAEVRIHIGNASL